MIIKILSLYSTNFERLKLDAEYSKIRDSPPSQKFSDGKQFIFLKLVHT